MVISTASIPLGSVPEESGDDDCLDMVSTPRGTTQTATDDATGCQGRTSYNWS
ncbi:hypothetical protein BN903_155 [Halorubrum sp. AJ67]|nr:hypothetical protein BN903_155 [Halorubrum sp. AJ67]